MLPLWIIKKQKQQEKPFIQEQLQIELPIYIPLPKKEKDDDEEEKRGVIVIDLF